MRQLLQGPCQGVLSVGGLQLPHQQHKASQLLVLLHMALPLRRPLLSGGQAAFPRQKVRWADVERIILQQGRLVPGLCQVLQEGLLQHCFSHTRPHA